MLMRHSEVVVPVCWLMVLETMENHVFFNYAPWHCNHLDALNSGHET